MKFYEVVRHNRRLKSEQTPFYSGRKIRKISFLWKCQNCQNPFFIAVLKLLNSPDLSAFLGALYPCFA